MAIKSNQMKQESYWGGGILLSFWILCGLGVFRLAAVFQSMEVEATRPLAVAFFAVAMAFVANIILFFIKPGGSNIRKVLFNMALAVVFLLSLSLPVISVINRMG